MIVIENDCGVRVPGIDLYEEFSAPPTRCKNGVFRDRDNHLDLRLACLDHLSRRRMFCTESNAAAKMNTYSGVNPTSGR